MALVYVVIAACIFWAIAVTMLMMRTAVCALMTLAFSI